jgi:hypothetical protein
MSAKHTFHNGNFVIQWNNQLDGTSKTNCNQNKKNFFDTILLWRILNLVCDKGTIPKVKNTAGYKDDL